MKLYRTFLVLCIVAVVGFILYNSTRTGERSSEISQGVTDKVIEQVIPDYSELDSSRQQELSHKLHLSVRSIAHAVEFCALAGLLCLLLFTFNMNHGRYPMPILITLFFCFAFALSDEMLQGAFAGRGTDIMDVVMDMIGVAVAVIGAVLVDAIGCKLLESDED